jgi:hypothetical protein
VVVAVLSGRIYMSAMQSYMKHWMIDPYHIKQLQDGLRHSKEE